MTLCVSVQSIPAIRSIIGTNAKRELDVKRREFIGTTLAAGAAVAGALPATGEENRVTTRIMKLPCEEAFSIPEIVDAASKLAGGVPSMSTGLIAGPLLTPLLDIGEGRIASMDAAGVDMHVLSP